MRRVLVTGAAGLIGSATLELLAAQGTSVTVLVLADEVCSRRGRPIGLARHLWPVEERELR